MTTSATRSRARSSERRTICPPSKRAVPRCRRSPTCTRSASWPTCCFSNSCRSRPRPRPRSWSCTCARRRHRRASCGPRFRDELRARFAVAAMDMPLDADVTGPSPRQTRRLLAAGLARTMPGEQRFPQLRWRWAATAAAILASATIFVVGSMGGPAVAAAATKDYVEARSAELAPSISSQKPLSVSARVPQPTRPAATVPVHRKLPSHRKPPTAPRQATIDPDGTLAAYR